VPNDVQNSGRATARVKNKMTFATRINLSQIDASLRAIADRDRFAVVKALTRTAQDAQREESQHLESVIDRPTPFTLRAIGIVPATKETMQAVVYVRPIQARYLRWLIDGGQRNFKGFELKLRGVKIFAYVVPGNSLGLDAYGNISRADIGRLQRDLESSSASDRYFIGSPKGRPDLPDGLYVRRAKSISLVLLFSNSAQYQKQFDFFGVGGRTIRERFAVNLARALSESRPRR
jgi:hypothetical protein